MADNRYLELIKDAKKYYESNAPELKNIRKDKALFDLTWCDGLEDEINIWNYWQGRGQGKVDIMIVGQDFGGCNSDLCRECVASSEKDAEIISNKYIDMIEKSKNPTDKTLIYLTEKCLGKEYSAGIPANKNLYMTNLCLGYRTGDKISGGDVYAHLKHDSIYLKKLIEIKKPRIVICLGADTYLAALTGLIEADMFDEYRDYLSKINSDFWKAIDDEENIKEIKMRDYSFYICGVAHTGNYGMLNRKKCSMKYKEEDVSAVEIMENDWFRIKEKL